MCFCVDETNTHTYTHIESKNLLIQKLYKTIFESKISLKLIVKKKLPNKKLNGSNKNEKNKNNEKKKSDQIVMNSEGRWKIERKRNHQTIHKWICV